MWVRSKHFLPLDEKTVRLCRDAYRNFLSFQASNSSMKRLLLLLVLSIALGACARPGDHPISPNCEWIEADSRSLDLTRVWDRRHLRFDAETAEDVAIRWGDHHFHLLPEWDRRVGECMETLFQGVARQHHVDVATVRQYSRQRDIVVDAAVILSIAVVYAVVAYIFAGRILRQFPPDEAGFWVMTLTLAVGVSLVGVLAGGLWSIAVENIRLNSGHLSYRMNRIPFREHWAVVWACGFIVFALTALLRSRAHLKSSPR